MDPEFPVSAIQLDHMGSCKTRVLPPPQPPSVDIATDESSAESSHDEYLVTFIVPAVIIAAMLFLAGIFACILYRRRRTGKMNVEEDGRATYGNKGIYILRVICLWFFNASRNYHILMPKRIFVKINKILTI